MKENSAQGANSAVILVVEDEPAMREVLHQRFMQWGYGVVEAGTVVEAERALQDGRPDAIVCDVVLPDGTGLDLLGRLTGDGQAPPPVIMMTAHGTVDTAVEALKLGAVDFLTKPLDTAKLRSVLEESLAEGRNRRDRQRLNQVLTEGQSLGGLVGQSRAMREVHRLIEVVAESDAPALITGESGTGKELAARAIHDLGRRSKGPFVAVNAAAIPEGLLESEIFGHERGAFTGAVAARAGCFEQADGGSLLLDEIAEMPVALQPKFLRTLEDGRVKRLGGVRETAFDVRVLAATNRVPEEAVREGLLRADLYYRLNVFTIVLPPLRDRLDDLPLILQHFVGIFNGKHGTSVEGPSPAVLDLLQAYAWPGNVREVRNVVERAVILARRGLIQPSHLPPYVRRPPGALGLHIPPGLTMAEVERLLIVETLKASGDNKAEAARRLGVDVKTIRNKLKSSGQDQDP